MTRNAEEHQRITQREIEIRKVEAACEKRQAEAEHKIKLFEKQKQELEQKDKELKTFREMYRFYMNQQIPSPSQDNLNSHYRTNGGGFWLFWLA